MSEIFCIFPLYIRIYDRLIYRHSKTLTIVIKHDNHSTLEAVIKLLEHKCCSPTAVDLITETATKWLTAASITMAMQDKQGDPFHGGVHKVAGDFMMWHASEQHSI